jgi:proteasome assembly chaperone (PAC2) family protein
MCHHQPMNPKQLKLDSHPKLNNGTLLLALTGWMDGGQVSTGTVKHLMGMGRRTNRRVAHIEPDDFYIYNFPGDMEMSALFRPHVHYDEGLVKSFEFPTNYFYCDEPANLLFFVGKEPNLKWQAFADCIFAATKAIGVSRIIFIGSFGGSVPHTREPRLYASVSDPKLLELVKQYRLRTSEYEGPGSFATLLLHEAPKHEIEMLSLVAEIPGYLDGINPLSIEAVTRRLGPMLNLPIDLDTLRDASNDWETRVTAAVEKDDELAETVRKLEEQYDDELINEAS